MQSSGIIIQSYRKTILFWHSRGSLCSTKNNIQSSLLSNFITQFLLYACILIFQKFDTEISVTIWENLSCLFDFVWKKSIKNFKQIIVNKWRWLQINRQCQWQQKRHFFFKERMTCEKKWKSVGTSLCHVFSLARSLQEVFISVFHTHTVVVKVNHVLIHSMAVSFVESN